MKMDRQGHNISIAAKCKALVGMLGVLLCITYRT